jgi:cysteinyl-tRNA synthetase
MTEVHFYNTLHRELQRFEPAQGREVRLYTCGPTVYDTAHIGNLRTFLFEDVLSRSLELLGWDVHQVMNLTDVDDKIIAGTLERGLDIDDFVAPHIEDFFRDLDRLRIRRAREYPRATRHVPEMIEMIRTLEEKDFAYESEGSVFFRIERDEDYGRLSGVDLSEARRGERVAADEYEKEDVRDFVLWKAAKHGEPSWPSPWGEGRPGWHIECSAMSMKYLGRSFDIHCGGVDNIFPHHENEIAQSESATGEVFAHFWLHSEHLLVDGQKMSKSLGNQYRLQDLLERGLDLRAVRYLFLSVHYRQKLNFTFESVAAAGAALRRVDDLRFRLAHARESAESSTVAAAAETLERDFAAALAEDLNLSAALAAVHTFVRQVNVALADHGLAPGDRERVEEALRWADRVLDVLDAEAWAQEPAPAAQSDDEIDALVEARTEARRQRDFAAADRIRDELLERGIVIEDTPDGPRWKRA